MQYSEMPQTKPVASSHVLEVLQAAVLFAIGEDGHINSLDIVHGADSSIRLLSIGDDLPLKNLQMSPFDCAAEMLRMIETGEGRYPETPPKDGVRGWEVRSVTSRHVLIRAVWLS